MKSAHPTPASPVRRSWSLRSSAALLALAMFAGISAKADAAVYISVGFAPPALPMYAQPMIPGPGYIWTPGYWAYADDGGYYWVRGTWVLAPFAGALWTPGYWGWNSGVYVFNRGYWGNHVGFYGGINYGYGYTGMGYAGGYWRGGGFYYNRSVNRIGGNVTHVYNHTVINNVTINRTSFNGGRGGIAARPTSQQAGWAHEQHMAPVASQQRQREMASHDPSMRASVNHGTPSMAATPRAENFSGQAAEHGDSARFVHHGQPAENSREAYGGYRGQAQTSRGGYAPRAEAYRPAREFQQPMPPSYREQPPRQGAPYRAMPAHANAAKAAPRARPPERREREQH